MKLCAKFAPFLIKTFIYLTYFITILVWELAKIIHFLSKKKMYFVVHKFKLMQDFTYLLRALRNSNFVPTSVPKVSQFIRNWRNFLNFSFSTYSRYICLFPGVHRQRAEPARQSRDTGDQVWLPGAEQQLRIRVFPQRLQIVMHEQPGSELVGFGSPPPPTPYSTVN